MALPRGHRQAIAAEPAPPDPSIAADRAHGALGYTGARARLASRMCARSALPRRPRSVISEAMEARLKTKLQVMAAGRLCPRHPIPNAVARTGGEESGLLLVKLNQRDRAF